LGYGSHVSELKYFSRERGIVGIDFSVETKSGHKLQFNVREHGFRIWVDETEIEDHDFNVKDGLEGLEGKDMRYRGEPRSRRIRVGEIWAEMARRKVRFHPNKKWDEIRMWGLFTWGSVKRQLDRGELITDMKKENRTIWVQPSKQAWEEKIKPLIEQHSLDELTKLAGW
jgi:hypothetical protein